jgi:hypothetical protein
MYTRRVYESVGEYDPELFLVEDYDYFIRIAKRFRICHLAEPLYYFRRHDDALFVSRFCEVKASDFLGRYKNELLSEADVLDAVLDLLLRNPDDLNSLLLRRSHRWVRGFSFRLTKLHERVLSEYLRWRLHRHVSSLLEAYRSKTIAFGPARDRLCGLMREFGAIVYHEPQIR